MHISSQYTNIMEKNATYYRQYSRIADTAHWDILDTLTGLQWPSSRTMIVDRSYTSRRDLDHLTVHVCHIH